MLLGTGTEEDRLRSYRQAWCDLLLLAHLRGGGNLALHLGSRCGVAVMFCYSRLSLGWGLASSVFLLFANDDHVQDDLMGSAGHDGNLRRRRAQRWLDLDPPPPSPFDDSTHNYLSTTTHN